jgi:hypothetical protein
VSVNQPPRRGSSMALIHSVILVRKDIPTGPHCQRLRENPTGESGMH